MNEPDWMRDPVPLADRRPVVSQALVALDWHALMAEPPTPAPTIRPGLPEEGVTVLAGSPKVGKTLFASQTAIESNRPALFIVEEGTLSSIAYRMSRQALGLDIAAPPITVLHRQRIRLDSRGSVDRLLGLVDQLRPGLVVLDPLNRLHGADENRPSAMTPVMDAMARIAYDRHCAVLAIHHLAKPSQERRGDVWDRFRGAGSIRSGTDANLAMDGSGDHVKLVGEFRDADPLVEHLELDREWLLFHPGEAPEAPAKVDPMALRTFVLDRGQVTARQVMEQFSVTKVTALKALRNLGCDEYAGTRGILAFSLGTVQ